MKIELKPYFIPCLENNFRPKIIEIKPLILYLAFLTLIYLTFLNIIPNSQYFAAITKSIIFELTNYDRINEKINTLVYSPILEEAARLKAEDMIKNNYFSHTSPQGASPWRWFEKAGYDYSYAGENLAMGFTDAETVNAAWLNSPAHRANILNKNYKEFGVAIATGKINGNETMIVVQLFGAPQVQTNAEKPLTRTESKPTPLPTITPLPTPQNILNSATEQTQESMKQLINTEAKNLFKSDLEKIKTNKILTALSNFGFNFAGGLNKLIIYIFGAFLTLMFIALLINIFTEIRIQHPDIIIGCLVMILLVLIAIIFGMPSIDSLKISALSL